MADLPPGPYGEPVFPSSEPDLTLDGFIRYYTKAPFDEVAAFFEKKLGNVKHIFSARAEEHGRPHLVFSTGVRYTDATWAAIIVTPPPAKGKKPGKGAHIIVTKKG